MASWQDIERNLKFEQLVSKRNRRWAGRCRRSCWRSTWASSAWSAFAPGLLGIPMIGVITSGVIIGVLVILRPSC